MTAAMHFANPEWLWVVAGFVVLFAVLIWISARARRRQLSAFADASLLAAMLGSHSPARRVVKNALILCAGVSLGLALARPQWGAVAEELRRSKGEDVVFVLDLSKSMLATDVTPSRLERAKLAIMDYLHHQSGGRMGLVVFAGNAFLRCPLTMDYAAFEESVMSTSPEDLYVPGTDLGTALAVGKSAFEKTEKRKLLVLLTDGEDLEKLGVKAAEEFAKEGIVVFTVGMGTASGAAVQTFDPRTGQIVPMLDATGQPVISKLDEVTLKSIAEATGGTYRRLDRISNAMDDVVRSLKSTDTTTVGFAKRRGVDRYAWFLAVAILFLVAESLLATRRRKTA